MPIRTALWKVNAKPERLVEAVLPNEKLLEDNRQHSRRPARF